MIESDDEIAARLTTLGREQASMADSEALYRPTLFRLVQEADRRGLRTLLDRLGSTLLVHDTLWAQVQDLVQARSPERKMTAAELDRAAREHLHGVAADSYGVWAFYPWSRRLVHLLDAEEFAELRTNRNRHKITRDEQRTLAGKRVGVVGLSVGQSVAVTMALERSAGELRLADFDHLDLSNLNRIRTGIHNIGVPKVYVTAREIAEIDPYLQVAVFTDGITSDNTEAFLLRGGALDAVVEECDSLDVKVMIRHRARAHRIPVIMDTSDRGMLDVERFDLEPARPLFHGLAGDLDPAGLAGLTTEQKLPYVLQIVGAGTMSTRLRASLIEVNQTISTWPQLAAEVMHGGAAAANTVRRLLLGAPVPSGRFFFDLDDLRPLDAAAATTPLAAARPARARSGGSAAKVCDATVRSLVSQAILAPSGGNSQPWRWVADGDEVHLLLDRTRSSGLIDYESGGSYAALGCAAETMVIAAHAAGLSVRMRPFPFEDRSDCAASFDLRPPDRGSAAAHGCDGLHPQIARRYTNRRPGDGRPLALADVEGMSAAVRSVAGAEVQWVVERSHVASLGEIVGRGDRIRLLHPQYHAEMYDELRWSAGEAKATGDGIDVHTLDLTPGDRAGLELCRDPRAVAMVREWGGGGNLEKSARTSAATASAFGMVTMPATRAVDYFHAGRAIQRLWLTASERSLAIHPMTALPYLIARVGRGHGAGLDGRTIEEILRLRAPFRSHFAADDDVAEVLLFRVAHAEASENRSARRGLDDVLSRA